MSRKQMKFLYIIFISAVLAFFLMADPLNLSIINQEESLVGPVSKGDFLILFSVFGTTVTIVMFLFTGRWRRKR